MVGNFAEQVGRIANALKNPVELKEVQNDAECRLCGTTGTGTWLLPTFFGQEVNHQSPIPQPVNIRIITLSDTGLYCKHQWQEVFPDII